MTLLTLFIFFPAFLMLCVTLWNVTCWPEVNAQANGAQPGTVSILIPARDEETNLAACLDRALSQGAIVLEILVYDDHSTDSTARIIDEYAGRHNRVRRLSPKTLPEGWCGKPFACSQLAAAAVGEWLLFLDADAHLGAETLGRMVAEAQVRGVSLLSCWPALELVSFWERVLMPMLNFVVFTLYPAPLALRRGTASLGLAHGSSILARRNAYVRTGGHELVRDEIFEDVRLAQRWREHGENSLCLDGQRVVSVRMYHSFGEIWRGFQKNFFPAFRREASFWIFIALHFFIFLLPFFIVLFAFKFRAVWPLALSVLSVLAMRFALALRFKHPMWSVLLHPLAEFVLIAVGTSSWWSCRNGHGVEWKGRTYPRGKSAQKGRSEITIEPVSGDSIGGAH